MPKLHDAEATEAKQRKAAESAAKDPVGEDVRAFWRREHARALEDLRGYRALFPDFYPENA